MAQKIIIVDDSRLTRSIIRNALTAVGYEVIGEAVNGRDGVALFASLRPDLVTMDLTMPDSYGMESVKEILALDPKAKILVVTALNQKLLVDDALRLGARAMISKPFQPYELAKIVGELVGPPEFQGPAQLTQDQIDDLAELGNIGVGNAAGRLSDMIEQRCLMDIPRVDSMAVADIKRDLDPQNSFAVALHIKIMGDIPALMFVITKRVHAQLLVSYMTKAMPEAAEKDLSFQALLALKQLGETLTKTFSEAISQFLNTKARYAMPDILIDRWDAALDEIFRKMGRPDEQFLVLRCAFFTQEKTFEGRFVYILDSQAQRTVVGRIKLLLMKS